MIRFNQRTQLLFLIIFAALFLGFKRAPSDSSQTITDELISKLALKNELKATPSNIETQFKQNFLQLSSQKNKLMLKSFRKAYDTNQLLNDFRASLRKKMNSQYRSKIEAWLQKSSTQAVNNARREYYTLQGKRKRVVAMYKMEKHPPAAERMHLFAEMRDTTAANQSSIESSVTILRYVIRAYGNLNEKHNFSRKRVNAIVNSFRSEMLSRQNQQQSNFQGNRQLAVMYHNVKTKNLKDYLKFFETDAGQWLTRAINKSMNEAYKTGGKRFLQIIGSS
ncbi:MAG TPA: hypothetical protein VE868_13850 [Balneolaceae bacterium]|nr:hypothetical protein [Balneolaceae bacterium]